MRYLHVLALMVMLASGSSRAWGAISQSSIGQSSIKIVQVSAERFAFTPSEITVDRGTTIEFHLTSEDTDHGFRIVDTAVDVRIPKRRRGETVVKYTADTVGRFVIECSHPCGAGHTAMRALLIVK